jgi:hypothetical protein
MIVEYHGGKLTASSDHKRGASFQFILPVASAENDSARAKKNYCRLDLSLRGQFALLLGGDSADKAVE